MRKGLAAVLAGAALVACVVGWALSWFGPSEVSPAPLLGVVLGLTLGLERRLRLPALWLPLGVVLALGLSSGPVPLPGQALVGAALLALCGAGAGSLLRVASANAPARFALALCGALPLLLAGDVVPRSLWLPVGAVLALASAALLRGETAAVGVAATDSVAARRSTWVTGVASLRLGSCLLVTAAALAFQEGSTGTGAAGPMGGALHATVPVTIGLLAGFGLAGVFSSLRGGWVAVVCEPLGWTLILLAAWRLPQWLGSGGGTLWLAAGTASALSALSLSGPLRRGGGRGLLCVVLAWPLAGPLLEAGAEHWSTPDRLSLAMGKRGPADDALRRAAETERARVRFAARGPSAVHVVDVTVGRQGTVRLLALDGDVLAGAPTHAAGSSETLVSPILQAALPLLLAPKPPRRVAVLGLDMGVTCGVLLRGGLDVLAVVEPASGVVRAHRDPGDLFGYVNHRPLADSRLRLHEVAIASFLRAQPRGGWDAIVASRPPLEPPYPGLVTSRSAFVCWATRRPSQAQLASLPGRVFVFAPAGEDLLVVAGEGLKVSVPRLRARLRALPKLRTELARIDLGDPFALLSTLVAGPQTVAALVPGSDPLTSLELAGAGAANLSSALTYSVDARVAAGSMAALSQQLALRGSVAALPMARAAVARDRSGPTLQMLGDVLRAFKQDEAALAAFTEALELDEGSVSTRLSLAFYHLGQKAWRPGLTVLLPALGREPERDPEVHYHLGKLALGAKEFRLARRHLRKAGSFNNAADLLLLADQMAGPAEPRKLPPRHKLAAAERLVSKARAARTFEEATRLWDNAVATALPLAHEPGALSRPEQLRLARVLERCGESRDPVARKLVAGLEADLLEVHAGDPAIGVRRARALARAGRGEEGERLLAEVVAAGGKQRALAQRALGDVLEVQGKLQAAVAAWERFLDMTPAGSLHAKVYLAIADVERRRGRREHAVRALRAAERVQPGHPKVRLNLGTLLFELGRKGEGLEAYRGFLEVAPPNHPMLERVRRLVGD